jgi:hypothetical protein
MQFADQAMIGLLFSKVARYVSPPVLHSKNQPVAR